MCFILVSVNSLLFTPQTRGMSPFVLQCVWKQERDIKSELTSEDLMLTLILLLLLFL